MSETKTENKEKRSGKHTARMIVESALMVALATGLSVIKLLDLPYGGSVTVASMLPLIIIGTPYRSGIRSHPAAARA